MAIDTYHTYLTFAGNCREAFEFYRSVFGGDFHVFATFGEGPSDMDVPAAQKHLVMHVSLPIGGGVLMGSDAGPQAPAVNAGNNSPSRWPPAASKRAMRCSPSCPRVAR